MSDSTKITPESFLVAFAPFCVALGKALRESFQLPGQPDLPTETLLARMEEEMQRIPPEELGEARKLLEILRRTLRSPALKLLDPPEGPPN